MPVTDIKTMEEFRNVLSSPEISAIDFWAPWCGPCKVIKPIFKKFSDTAEFAGLKFYEVNTEELDDAQYEVGIKVMPTFMLFQDGNKVGESLGAYPKPLQELLRAGVAKLSGAPTSTEALKTVDAAATPTPTPTAPQAAPVEAAKPAPAPPVDAAAASKPAELVSAPSAAPEPPKTDPPASL